MTESKVDLLAVLDGDIEGMEEALHLARGQRRIDLIAGIEQMRGARAAVAELIESIEAALNHSNHVCITQHGGKRSPEAAEHYDRIRAALAACTPAKEGGKVMERFADGGPAFPNDYIDPAARAQANACGMSARPHFGMTLRDYFAAKELSEVEAAAICDRPEVYARVADHCYRMADAMLAARTATPAKGENNG